MISVIVVGLFAFLSLFSLILWCNMIQQGLVVVDGEGFLRHPGLSFRRKKAFMGALYSPLTQEFLAFALKSLR